MRHPNFRHPIRLPDGSRALLCMPLRTQARLADTAFRPNHLALAGNLACCQSARELLCNTKVQRAILAHAQRTINIKPDGVDMPNQRIEIAFDRPIGWSSTSNVEGGIDPTDNLTYEPFQPNARTQAHRVRTDRVDILAPATNIITLTFSVRFSIRDGWIIVIWTVYPGPDIGRLEGDMTEKTGQAFLDWNHPGEPIENRVAAK